MEDILAANGEIYNHNELREDLEKNYNFLTKSDWKLLLLSLMRKEKNLLTN